MSGNLAITASDSVTYQGVAAPAPVPPSQDLTFGEVLSDLNPLQYLPVIGTIYRSLTGDTIPKPLREAGSLVVSGLVGGPIGLVTNLSVLALQKLTGIDLEDLEQNVLANLGIAKTPAAAALVQNAPGGQPPAAPSAAAPSAAAAIAANEAVTAPAQPAGGGAWTPSQLAAYGVTTLKNGDLQRNGLTGADVLNDLQLQATAGTLVDATASGATS